MRRGLALWGFGYFGYDCAPNATRGTEVRRLLCNAWIDRIHYLHVELTRKIP
jgi:hypothetical protein